MVSVGSYHLSNIDLTIVQGATTSFTLVYSEVDAVGELVANDFIGWTARSQIRSAVGGEVWHQIAFTYDRSGNKFTLIGVIPADTTESAEWNDRTTGVWDIEIVRDDNTVIPFNTGRVNITHDVTRSTP